MKMYKCSPSGCSTIHGLISLNGMQSHCEFSVRVLELLEKSACTILDLLDLEFQKANNLYRRTIIKRPHFILLIKDPIYK